nr:MDS1 and EVI1 complex locus protein EVI1-like [Biomphalaria glabrata]
MISTTLDIKHVSDSSSCAMTIQSQPSPSCAMTIQSQPSPSCAMTIQSQPSPVAAMLVDDVHDFKFCGVVAGNDIPELVTVKVHSTDVTLGRDLIASIDSQIKARCIKVFWKNKQLETNSEYRISACLAFVRSARDRHEQNVELLQKDSCFFVRTIRTIKQGEQLLIWYEDGHAREVGVPILTLSHIRGHQNYMCTTCGVTFTHPNILKAHMFLQCSSSTTPLVPSTAQSLVPFQQLLQTISKMPTSNASSGPKKSKQCELSPRRQHCWGQVEVQQDKPYKSAFRTYPSSSRDTPKGSDEALMTPDSSTDQSSALNLSVKHTNRHLTMGTNTISSWNLIDPKHMLQPLVALPLDYPSMAGCYPISSHLHPLDVKILHGQAAHSHSFQNLMETRAGCHMDFPLSSSQIDTFQDTTTNTHNSSVSPGVRNFRHNNPYGFTLPSDKEPLDLLPQAYFANKSKKGHLCLCCGKLYSRKYGLKIHMRTHNGYKPLKCKICSRPFGDPSNLNKHVRLHAQGETPYRCEYCGKVLVRRRDLERHVRSRHPMGCVDTDEAMCESSPDSSLISVTADSPEDLLEAKHTSLNDSSSN